MPLTSSIHSTHSCNFIIIIFIIHGLVPPHTFLLVSFICLLYFLFFLFPSAFTFFSFLPVFLMVISPLFYLQQFWIRHGSAPSFGLHSAHFLFCSATNKIIIFSSFLSHVQASMIFWYVYFVLILLFLLCGIYFYTFLDFLLYFYLSLSIFSSAENVSSVSLLLLCILYFQYKVTKLFGVCVCVLIFSHTWIIFISFPANIYFSSIKAQLR